MENNYDVVITNIQRTLIEINKRLGDLENSKNKGHNHPILETKIDKVEQEVKYLRNIVKETPNTKETPKESWLERWVEKLK